MILDDKEVFCECDKSDDYRAPLWANNGLYFAAGLVWGILAAMAMGML